MALESIVLRAGGSAWANTSKLNLGALVQCMSPQLGLVKGKAVFFHPFTINYVGVVKVSI